MKKVNWLIEQDIYDRESELLAELQKQGYIYKQTKYLNFCLENETTLVLVSGKRAITKESRFFLSKNWVENPVLKDGFNFLVNFTDPVRME